MSNHPRRQNLAAYWLYLPSWAVPNEGRRTRFMPKHWKRTITKDD